MAGTHSFVNATKTTSMNNDAYLEIGINTTTDFDNGTLVSLGSMKLGSSTGANGYEFAVTAPSANATGLYVIDTPEAEWPVEAQIYDDPRYFVNKAGRPMTLRYLNPVVDKIEWPASAFTTNYDPDTIGATGVYASVETTGKLKTVTSAPGSGTYFNILGSHSVDIGTETVKTWILQVARN